MSEFFYMGGYALYVWGSFGVAALLMLIEPVLLNARFASASKRVKRLIRLKGEGQP